MDTLTLVLVALIVGGALFAVYWFFRQNRQDLRDVKERLKHEQEDVEFSTHLDAHRKNVARSA